MIRHHFLSQGSFLILIANSIQTQVAPAAQNSQVAPAAQKQPVRRALCYDEDDEEDEDEEQVRFQMHAGLFAYEEPDYPSEYGDSDAYDDYADDLNDDDDDDEDDIPEYKAYRKIVEEIAFAAYTDNIGSSGNLNAAHDASDNVNAIFMTWIDDLHLYYHEIDIHSHSLQYLAEIAKSDEISRADAQDVVQLMTAEIPLKIARLERLKASAAESAAKFFDMCEKFTEQPYVSDDGDNDGDNDDDEQIQRCATFSTQLYRTYKDASYGSGQEYVSRQHLRETVLMKLSNPEFTKLPNVNSVVYEGLIFQEIEKFKDLFQQEDDTEADGNG